MILAQSLAAGVIAVALLWLVLQPILAPDHSVPVDFDFPDPEETPRGRALLALKEIEFDRATGKLSDEDYAALTAKYSAVAVATLEAEAHAAATPHCRQHGIRPEADARFCATCGAGLLSPEGNCAACATPVPAAAHFCPGCGVGLANNEPARAPPDPQGIC